MKKLNVILMCAALVLFAACDSGYTPKGGNGSLLLGLEPSTSGTGGGTTVTAETPYEQVLLDAAAIVAATKISNDNGVTDIAGKPVYIGFYWVSQDEVDALDAAINMVKEETVFLLSAGVSPGLLGSYAAEIQIAVDAFKAARTMGTQPLDWASLDTAYAQARADYDAKDPASLPASPPALDLLDDDTGAIYKTTETPAAYLVYAASLAEIKDWLDKGKLAAAGTITQDEIDQNIAKLSDASRVFAASLGRSYWVTVPAGQFQRDATAANISVITVPFKMGIYEVTQELFMAVMEIPRLAGWNNANSTGSVELLPADGARGGNTSSAGIGLPHAYAFCNRLSYLKGKTPVYSITTSNSGSPSTANVAAFNTGNPLISYAAIPAECNTITCNWTADGFRLPTEMEWMWAAMGANAVAADMSGATNVRGYSKAFAGDNLDDPYDVATDFAWIPANTGATSGNDNRASTRQVGTKKPNEIGIYDLSGNLAEFCWDLGGAATELVTAAGTLTDYRGMASGGTGRRVVMGGDYGGNYTYGIKRTAQNGTWANYQHAYYGFRIVYNAR